MPQENMTLPFERGTAAGFTATTDGVPLEGQEFWVPDTQYNTGRDVKLRVVRNNSGTTLSGKRLVGFTDARKLSVTGYGATTNAYAKPIDDAYGGTTIPDKDLFYVVMAGPCLVKTTLAGDGTNVLTAGNWVQCCTGATTGATSSGRIEAGTFAITGNTAPTLMNQIAAMVGRCMTSRTTNNTDTDTLVEVKDLF